MMVPLIGARALTSLPAPVSGVMATPGPTILPEKTGSGTSLRATTTPDTGDWTVRLTAGPRCPPRCVRVGADHDLHDVAELDDTVRSGGLQGRLIHEGTVLQLAAQPRDAGFDLHDVVESSEGVDDALCLRHGFLLGLPGQLPGSVGDSAEMRRQDMGEVQSGAAPSPVPD